MYSTPHLVSDTLLLVIHTMTVPEDSSTVSKPQTKVSSLPPPPQHQERVGEALQPKPHILSPPDAEADPARPAKAPLQQINATACRPRGPRASGAKKRRRLHRDTIHIQPLYGKHGWPGKGPKNLLHRQNRTDVITPFLKSLSSKLVPRHIKTNMGQQNTGPTTFVEERSPLQPPPTIANLTHDLINVIRN